MSTQALDPMQDEPYHTRVSHRCLSTLLVVFVTLWGVGLPRFVHVMTAHAPGNATVIAQADTTPVVRCTSRCCTLHAPVPTPQDSPSDPHTSDDAHASHSGCDESHHCNICDLLATLLTDVPALPMASTAWEPIAERIVDAPQHVVLVCGFDPHAPRGPPTRA